MAVEISKEHTQGTRRGGNSGDRGLAGATNQVAGSRADTEGVVEGAAAEGSGAIEVIRIILVGVTVSYITSR